MKFSRRTSKWFVAIKTFLIFDILRFAFNSI